MTQFRFSPRPNRAAEINWQEWGDKPFYRAREENKLVLLAISGVWCHWCHVMDEKTYSDPGIIEIINSQFIPIRVDTDQRPDINQRYNLGGWPTTAILTPEGDLIAGGTYLPPDRLAHLLEEVNAIYRESGSELKHKLAARRWQQNGMLQTGDKRDFPEDLVEKIEAKILSRYDRKWGGFGDSPKFPMAEALLYAIDAFHRTGDIRWKEVFVHTMEKMASKGMYDHVEGGFFRYSTDPEWRVPHYEKMLEDNSRLMTAYLRAWQVTGQIWFLDIARDVLNYLCNHLFMRDENAWAGTQDADEEYYRLDKEQRRQVQAPFVDKTIYTDWNAMMAESLLLLGITTGVNQYVETGILTLESLWKRSWNPERGLAHYYESGEARLYRQLADAVAYGRAANQAYQATGQYHWLKRSQLLADFCIFHLERPGGGFFDIIPTENAPGALAEPLVDLPTNARAALWLLELAALNGMDRYRGSARKALFVWKEDYVLAHGPIAAGYASALLAAEKPWTVVTVVGLRHDQQAQEMVREALRQYLPHRVVRWADPTSDPELVKVWVGPDLPREVTAYVCTGNTCLPPAHSIDQLLKYQSEGAWGR